MLQQTFVRALGALRGLEPEHPRAWLFTIARNRACPCSARAARWQRRDGDRARHPRPRRSRRAPQRAPRAARRHRLAAEPQRAALLLAQIEDFPQRRIAEVLGTSESRVKTPRVPCPPGADGRPRGPRRPVRRDPRRTVDRARPGAPPLPLRRHLRQCPGCRAFQRGVAFQREALAARSRWAHRRAAREALGGALAGGGAAAGGGAGPGGRRWRAAGRRRRGAGWRRAVGGFGVAGGVGAVLVKVAVAVVVAGPRWVARPPAASGAAPDARAQAPGGAPQATVVPLRTVSAAIAPPASPTNTPRRRRPPRPAAPRATVLARTTPHQASKVRREARCAAAGATTPATRWRRSAPGRRALTPAQHRAARA